MAAISKKSKGPKEEEIMDRLSDLPDSLIHHILSFLDTRIAVQTCVLSQRWKRLWTCVPILNFDSLSFKLLAHFKKFVRQVLSRRGPSNLHSLKFLSYSEDKTFTDRVLRYAVSHSVQEIVMNHGKNLMNQGIVSWKSLRTLHLERCGVSTDLLSICTNVETLILKECSLPSESVNGLKISAPRLVTLNITDLCPHSRYSTENDGLVVSCPRLSCFIYQGRCPPAFSMDGCPVLDRVNIRLYRKLHNSFTKMKKLEMYSCLKNLLQGLILHAKFLVLWEKGLKLKIISSNDDVRAIIHNEATNDEGELFWRRTEEEDFEPFLASILQRFKDLRLIAETEE